MRIHNKGLQCLNLIILVYAYDIFWFHMAFRIAVPPNALAPAKLFNAAEATTTNRTDGKAGLNLASPQNRAATKPL